MLQLATHAGARVTGVCGAGRLDLVRSLGADQVIDYTVQVPDLGLDDVRPDPPARRRAAPRVLRRRLRLAPR